MPAFFARLSGDSDEDSETCFTRLSLRFPKLQCAGVHQRWPLLEVPRMEEPLCIKKAAAEASTDETENGDKSQSKGSASPCPHCWRHMLWTHHKGRRCTNSEAVGGSCVIPSSHAWWCDNCKVVYCLACLSSLRKMCEELGDVPEPEVNDWQTVATKTKTRRRGNFTPEEREKTENEASALVDAFCQRRELAKWVRAELLAIPPQEVGAVLAALSHAIETNPSVDLRALLALKRSAGASALRRLDERQSRKLSDWIASLQLRDVDRNELFAVISAGFDKSEVEHLMSQTNYANKCRQGGYNAPIAVACRIMTDHRVGGYKGQVEAFSRCFRLSRKSEQQLHQVGPKTGLSFLQQWQRKPSREQDLELLEREITKLHMQETSTYGKNRKRMNAPRVQDRLSQYRNLFNAYDDSSGDEVDFAYARPEEGRDEDLDEIQQPFDDDDDEIEVPLDDDSEDDFGPIQLAPLQSEMNFAKPRPGEESTVTSVHSQSSLVDSLCRGSEERPGKRVPVATHFVVVVDVSGSMSELDCLQTGSGKAGKISRIDAVFSEVRQLVSAENARAGCEDKMSFITFSDGAKIHFQEKSLPAAGKTLQTMVRPAPEGRTFYAQGLRAAAACARKDSQRRPVDVIFLSDGEPSDPEEMLGTLGMELLPARSRHNELTVHCIGFGAGASGAASGRTAKGQEQEVFAFLQQLAQAMVMLRVVWAAGLAGMATAIRRERNLNMVTEESTEEVQGKSTCHGRTQRPEPTDGWRHVCRRSHWSKAVIHHPVKDFLQCKVRGLKLRASCGNVFLLALCDGNPQCIAFVRRAADDVGFLGSTTATLIASQSDQTKLLEVPNDVSVGDCWILEAGKLNRYKLIHEIKNRKLAGHLDMPFRVLSSLDFGLDHTDLEQKSHFYQDKSLEKLTFEKRDCNCEYRYLGLLPSPSSTALASTFAECAGEYRYIGREYAKYGFEAVYQRTDSQKFLYMCASAEGSAKTLTRDWYCMDKDDPNMLKEKAQNVSWIGKAKFVMGNGLFDFKGCIGTKLQRPEGTALLPFDLAVTHDEGEPMALSFPRVPAMALGPGNLFGDAVEVEGLTLKPGQAVLGCAAGKKQSEELKKHFLLQTSQCQLSLDSKTLAWVPGSTWDTRRRGRSYTDIIWRALALWEKVEKAVALINYIQDGVSSDGMNMTEGEKYACAEMMVDEIKSAGGIMPKVSQTLAMKPDVVKDDFVRSSLKSTQTENPAKDNEYVREYIARKLSEAIEQEERVNEGLVISSIDEHLDLGRTLATGSVAQVLQAKVKSRGEVRDFLCGEGAPPCDVVLKVVFDENEKKYKDDWEAIQFLGNDLLKLIHDQVSGGMGGVLLSWKLEPEKLEMLRHGVSAGSDTWQAVRQGLGAVMDEFDLRVEDLNAKKGLTVIKEFQENAELKRQLGIEQVTFEVPKVLMTRSRYFMVQSFAKGDTLTSYHASITGQADKLKEWRRTIYPSIIGLYGYLMVEKGFFQGDPHPGNWYWEADSKTLTLIDWGLADDFSGGLARAGKLYLDAQGNPPKQNGEEVTQFDVNNLIAQHKCQVARFYKEMGEFRRKELLCHGFAMGRGRQELVFVPSPSATIILDGGEPHLHSKYYARNLSASQAFTSDAFFSTPNFGTGRRKPLVLQRSRSATCEGSACGHGWELALVDGAGAKTYRPLANCISKQCVESSLVPDGEDGEACKKTCETVECLKHCEKFTGQLPTEVGGSELRPFRHPLCKTLPSREEAYARGAAGLGYSTQKNMHPVVLALFGALHTNDLLDLKARQENIQRNDPKEPGTSIPDYTAVMLRSLSVFLGMMQDMITENKPPFVSVMVTEFLMDTAPDEMFTFWHIFAKRFMDAEGRGCPAPEVGNGHFHRASTSVTSLRGAFRAVSSTIASSRTRSRQEDRSQAEEEAEPSADDPKDKKKRKKKDRVERNVTFELRNVIFDLDESDMGKRELKAHRIFYEFDGCNFHQKSEETTVFIRRNPFTKGGMRHCYGLRDQGLDQKERPQRMVAKKSKFVEEGDHDPLTTVDIYAKQTAVAHYYARHFRKQCRTYGFEVKLDFVPCYAYRPISAEDGDLEGFCGEQYVPGEFVKLTSNAGFVNREEYGGHAGMGAAFSHYSFEWSK
ncbi:unnamed protein product, partial [Effrenium voratum]